MSDDSDERVGRFADPTPEWKRFHPLSEGGEAPLTEEGLEVGWSEESEPETPVGRRWSLLWVAGLALGTLIAVAIVGYNYSTRETVPEKPVYRTVAERRAAVARQLADFLKATTIDQRLIHILEADRLRPMLGDYYARENADAIQVAEVDEVEAVELMGQSWLWLRFSDDGGRQHVAAFKDTPAGFKLDWESLVGYGEKPWDKLVKLRPAEPTQMRVYLRRGDYFNWKYQDREKYVSLEIESREPSQVLFGYVERGTELHAALARAVLAGARQPANIRLHFEADAGAENLVVIDELIHNLWFAPSILGEKR